MDCCHPQPNHANIDCLHSQAIVALARALSTTARSGNGCLRRWVPGGCLGQSALRILGWPEVSIWPGSCRWIGVIIYGQVQAEPASCTEQTPFYLHPYTPISWACLLGPLVFRQLIQPLPIAHHAILKSSQHFTRPHETHTSRPKENQGVTNQDYRGTPPTQKPDYSSVGSPPDHPASSAQDIVDNLSSELISRASPETVFYSSEVGNDLSGCCVPRSRQQDHLGLISVKRSTDGACHDGDHADPPRG